MRPRDRDYEVQADHGPEEPYLVPLTNRILSVAASPNASPEDLAAEREELEWRTGIDDGEEFQPIRELPPELVRLIDRVLPIEEAYLLKRSMLGASQRQLAADCGIKQPSVHYRIQRAIQRLRAAMDGKRVPVAPRARLTIPGAQILRIARVAHGRKWRKPGSAQRTMGW